MYPGPKEIYWNLGVDSGSEGSDFLSPGFYLRPSVLENLIRFKYVASLKK